MRKILVLIVFMILLTGCDNGNIEDISLNDLNQKFENKESFILYFEGTKSETLENTLNNILEENNLTAYSLDTSELNEDEINSLRLKVDYESPSIVFIVEGKDPSVITHVTDNYIQENDLLTRLKDLNFIK